MTDMGRGHCMAQDYEARHPEHRLAKALAAELVEFQQRAAWRIIWQGAEQFKPIPI